MAQQADKNAVVFESGDKLLAPELLTSSPSFTPADVRNFANVGAITREDASKVIARMEGSVVELKKEMESNILHRKALICLAKDKNDPVVAELLKLHEQEEALYSSLEAKYGEEAKINEGSLVGKLLTKFRGSNDTMVMESCRKVAEFQ